MGVSRAGVGLGPGEDVAHGVVGVVEFRDDAARRVQVLDFLQPLVVGVVLRSRMKA